MAPETGGQCHFEKLHGRKFLYRHFSSNTAGGTSIMSGSGNCGAVAAAVLIAGITTKPGRKAKHT